MLTKSRLRFSALALVAGAAGLGAIALATPASARVFVGFGFGPPVFGPRVVYAAPPVVYTPPVVYAPPPVVVQPAYVSQPAAASTWYFCDNPRGYYPNVTACSAGWREVPAQPNAAPPAP